MTNNRFNHHVFVLVGAMVLFLATVCSNPLSIEIPEVPVVIEEPIEEPIVIPEIKSINVSDEEFILEWDYEENITGFFSVYYREVGSGQWILLKDNIVDSSLVINTSLLNYGNYEFAVKFITQDNQESELHTSLDNTAIPSSGWRLSWQR